MSDSPKKVYFWSIRLGCGIESEESAQFNFKAGINREDNTEEAVVKIIEKITVSIANNTIPEAKETAGYRQQEKTSLRKKLHFKQ